MSNSEIPGFYRLPLAERRYCVAERAGLSAEDMRIVSGEEGLCAERADHMVENALGVVGLPLGLCVYLRVNGDDRLVPMATEESSVVAAASHAAKLLRAGGGITVEASPPHMIGQIQILDAPDPEIARHAITRTREQLIERANSVDPCLVSLGGGALDIDVRHLPPLASGDPVGDMLVAHLIVDVRDAMGANTINAMCEHLAAPIAQLTGGRVRLRILSNMADRRTVVATGTVPFAALEGKGCERGEDLARGIEEASVFAERDPYRAATHNKGVMNGVDAVLIAFGQDWRAVEAGAHAYAARDGRYTALARWRVTADGLTGRLELPMAVGVVGGITEVHPTVGVARRLAGVRTAADLAAITSAVGLAQNLGALRALAAEGIQLGHMRVHARNMALAVGAAGHEVKEVAETIAQRGTICQQAAHEVLKELREAASATAPSVGERFDALRETYLPRIISAIDETLAEETPESSTLVEMCRYHMSTGGKRLRALLPLLVAEALGEDPGALVPFGACCEMLHNATLVHDDLQDGDELRRGKETVWRRYGAHQAVNLGDAMFYYTLLLVQRLDCPLARREAVARRVLRETLRVINGQEQEFALKEIETPAPADYFAMVEGKTSGLFALPMAGAAEICEQPPVVVAALQEAARHMGVLFQIQDDVLDLYGEKGRSMPGSDIREGKRSLLVVHALGAAAPAQAQHLRLILDLPRDETNAQHVAEVLEIFAATRALDVALGEIAARRARALAVPGLEVHEQMRRVVATMCDLFLQPIKPVIAQLGRAA